jgi:hypothetical protein
MDYKKCKEHKNMGTRFKPPTSVIGCVPCCEFYLWVIVYFGQFLKIAEVAKNIFGLLFSTIN